MTTLANPSMVDLLKLCCNPIEEEVEQYIEMTGQDWVVDEVACDLYTKDGMKFVLLDDDNEPIAAGGFDPVIPGVWQSWMLTTPAAWTTHGLAVTKQTRKVMDRLFEPSELGYRVRRVQTMALASREKACKWYEKGLRMTLESISKQFGTSGKDFACYTRLREQ